MIDIQFKQKIWLCIIGISMMLFSCEPLVETFEDVKTGTFYKASSLTPAPDAPAEIMVMTWNIRFGAARVPWFGDSCGDRVILKKSFVTSNLDLIIAKLNTTKADILMMQEVDIQSKRSAYVDEVKYILNRTHFNYAVYASYWKAQYIPSDGLGRMDMGNVIFSRWPISESIRIQLPLRGDQDALTEYFYLRRCILKAKIDLPQGKDFYVLNTHASAFSTDDTKRKQINRFRMELDAVAIDGDYFVAGGDLNLVPPVATKTDYCLDDKCPDESFHNPGDDPMHKEGSYFTPEITWLQEMFDSFQPAVTLTDYQSNEAHYFTSTPDWNGFYDRKIDYLFTNTKWIAGSDSTHHDALPLSDHCPVSAIWEAPK